MNACTLYFVKARVVFQERQNGFGLYSMPVGDEYRPQIKIKDSTEMLAVRTSDIPRGAKFGCPVAVSLQLIQHPGPQIEKSLQPGVSFQMFMEKTLVGEGILDSAVYEETVPTAKPPAVEEHPVTKEGAKNASIQRIVYLGIEISENGLSEFSGSQRIIFIPKADIQSVKVCFGSSAERPVIQIIAGLLLGGLGIAGAVMVMDSGLRGVLRGLRWGLGFMVFGAFGVWLLHETFKKTHYLYVTTPKDARKLVFRGKFKDAELNQFLLDGAKLGYVFET